MKSLDGVMVAVVVAGVLTFFTRAFSFIIFNKRKPPEYILFIEKYIPPMVMVILVFYCFAGVNFTTKPYGLPELFCACFVAVIHIITRNPLISIFGGTALYMFLITI